jgi:hypothetical protein
MVVITHHMLMSPMNSTKLEGRPLSCRLSDKANDQLRRWFEDDDALEQAMGGEYGLTCLQNFDFILCQICSV